MTVVDHVEAHVDGATRDGRERQRLAHPHVPPDILVDAIALCLVGLHRHAADTELLLRKRRAAQSDLMRELLITVS